MGRVVCSAYESRRNRRTVKLFLFSEGAQLLASSGIALTVNGKILGNNPKLISKSQKSVKKIAITEADLEDYPGMFVQKGAQPYVLESVCAPKIVSNKETIKAKLASGDRWTAKLTVIE